MTCRSDIGMAGNKNANFTCFMTKAALATQTIAAMQFLVLYQLADQMSVNVTFFVDGSNYSNDQVSPFM